ncbi:hypothetical protein B296_00036414 [Ensete ventricosum]|uniref:Cytochrome c oxidase subunit 5C n=1 Tax=Ensete ventricosum TaxID=4639 RepID=A0A426Y5M0_ENSVE|nr:hypothetical protein B296_00036414 [Ensete ventricosum]
MAAHKIAHATLKGPSVVKEICIGLTLGLFAGGLWKMYQWNEQRRTRAFYDMLEKGEITPSSTIVPPLYLLITSFTCTFVSYAVAEKDEGEMYKGRWRPSLPTQDTQRET